jgi:integrase/recombinase XerD
MSESQIFNLTDNSSIVNYLPAELCDGKEVYIQYYAKKPGTANLERKRIKLNKAKNKLNKTDFKQYCRAIIRNLNEKLAAGWNPFIEMEAPKGFTTLPDALETFLATKKRELTPNSIRSFTSFVNTIKYYCEVELKEPNIYVLNFTNVKAKEFLSHKWLKGDISAKTYNNYIVGYHAIWAWLVEFNYSKVNVFDSITRKKTKRKFRAEISADLRQKIKTHLTANYETAYWLMCELCFYGLIRPGEICSIETKNIDLKKQIILLTDTKNQNERVCTLPKHLVWLLADQLSQQNGKYLFSGKKMQPGNKKIDARLIAKRWEKLRNELGFDKNIQFYSQRDSGIIFLLGATKNAEFVRSQADHYSLEMTTKYTNHYRPNGIDEIKNIEI